MINIPGRLHSAADEHIVTGANEVFDDTQNKNQQQINSEKADLSSVVANVGYSGGKLTQTIGSTASDIVSASTIVTDGGGITSHQSVVLASGTNDGTLKLTVGSTATDNIAVKGLKDAAFKEVEETPTDNSTKLATSGGTKEAIDLASNGALALAMLMPKISDSTYSTVSMTTNPEFYSVITDSEDKIISGVRKDGSYAGLPYMEAVEAIIGVIDDIDNP